MAAIEVKVPDIGDFTDIPVVESQDYSDEERLYQKYRARYPAEWGDEAPEPHL
mgnify:CR=1 FL=1